MPRRTIAVAIALVLTASAAYLAGAAAGTGATGSGSTPPGVSNVVFLSHVNNPKVIPGFPGDPVFSLTTAFTVAQDGYYLQYVKEGEHTGSHYSAPCHFHVHARCAEDLAAGDFVLPAVVIDIRAKGAGDAHYHPTGADLKAWQGAPRAVPSDAPGLPPARRRQRWGAPTRAGGP